MTIAWKNQKNRHHNFCWNSGLRCLFNLFYGYSGRSLPIKQWVHAQ